MQMKCYFSCLFQLKFKCKMSQDEVMTSNLDAVVNCEKGLNLVMTLLRSGVTTSKDFDYVIEQLGECMSYCCENVDANPDLTMYSLRLLQDVLNCESTFTRLQHTVILKPLIKICVKVTELNVLRQAFGILNKMMFSGEVQSIVWSHKYLQTLVFKFRNQLSKTGDFESQAVIYEAMVRISTDKKTFWALLWFPEDELYQLFLSSEGADFEAGCRQLINVVNNLEGDERRVFSCKALTAFVGDVKMEDPPGYGLWIDFNYSSMSLSFYCIDPMDTTEDSVENNDSRLWETLSISKSNIISCSLKMIPENGTQDLLIELKTPYFIEPDERTHPLTPEQEMLIIATNVRIVFSVHDRLDFHLDKIFGDHFKDSEADVKCTNYLEESDFSYDQQCLSITNGDLESSHNNHEDHKTSTPCTEWSPMKKFEEVSPLKLDVNYSDGNHDHDGYPMDDSEIKIVGDYNDCEFVCSEKKSIHNTITLSSDESQRAVEMATEELEIMTFENSGVQTVCKTKEMSKFITPTASNVTDLVEVVQDCNRKLNEEISCLESPAVSSFKKKGTHFYHSTNKMSEKMEKKIIPQAAGKKHHTNVDSVSKLKTDKRPLVHVISQPSNMRCHEMPTGHDDFMKEENESFKSLTSDEAMDCSAACDIKKVDEIPSHAGNVARKESNQSSVVTVTDNSQTYQDNWISVTVGGHSNSSSSEHADKIHKSNVSKISNREDDETEHFQETDLLLKKVKMENVPDATKGDGSCNKPEDLTSRELQLKGRTRRKRKNLLNAYSNEVTNFSPLKNCIFDNVVSAINGEKDKSDDVLPKRNSVSRKQKNIKKDSRQQKSKKVGTPGVSNVLLSKTFSNPNNFHRKSAAKDSGFISEQNSCAETPIGKRQSKKRKGVVEEDLGYSSGKKNASPMANPAKRKVLTQLESSGAPDFKTGRNEKPKQNRKAAVSALEKTKKILDSGKDIYVFESDDDKSWKADVKLFSSAKKYNQMDKNTVKDEETDSEVDDQLFETPKRPNKLKKDKAKKQQETKTKTEKANDEKGSTNEKPMWHKIDKFDLLVETSRESDGLFPSLGVEYPTRKVYSRTNSKFTPLQKSVDINDEELETLKKYYKERKQALDAAKAQKLDDQDINPIEVKSTIKENIAGYAGNKTGKKRKRTSKKMPNGLIEPSKQKILHERDEKNVHLDLPQEIPTGDPMEELLDNDDHVAFSSNKEYDKNVSSVLNMKTYTQVQQLPNALSVDVPDGKDVVLKKFLSDVHTKSSLSKQPNSSVSENMASDYASVSSIASSRHNPFSKERVAQFLMTPDDRECSDISSIFSDDLENLSDKSSISSTALPEDLAIMKKNACLVLELTSRTLSTVMQFEADYFRSLKKQKLEQAKDKTKNSEKLHKKRMQYWLHAKKNLSKTYSKIAAILKEEKELDPLNNEGSNKPLQEHELCTLQYLKKLVIKAIKHRSS